MRLRQELENIDTMSSLSDIIGFLRLFPPGGDSKHIADFAKSVKEFSRSTFGMGLDRAKYQEILEEYDSRSKSGVKQVLYEGDGLFEIEVHQQMFFIDVLTTEQGYGQFFNVNYHPEYYGVYSDEVNEILEALAGSEQIEIEAGMYDRNIIAKYDLNTPPEADDNVKTAVDKMREEIGELSVDELVELSRNHWLRENTDLSKDVDFDQYQEDVDEGKCDETFNSDEPLNLDSVDFSG